MERINSQKLKDFIISLLKLRQSPLTQQHLELIIDLVMLNNSKYIARSTFDNRDAISDLDEEDLLVYNKMDEIELRTEENAKFKKGHYFK